MCKNERVIFVTGGARSGKSSWAMEYALKQTGKKLFVATARVEDDEMRERIRKHKDERGAEWALVEEPVNLPLVIADKSKEYDVILVDCLTLWLSNIMMDNASSHFDKLIHALENIKKQDAKARVVLVSNEVGMGIVPANSVAREFRDLAGIINQRVAKTSDKAVFVASGLPLYLK